MYSFKVFCLSRSPPPSRVPREGGDKKKRKKRLVVPLTGTLYIIIYYMMSFFFGRLVREILVEQVGTREGTFGFFLRTKQQNCPHYL